MFRVGFGRPKGNSLFCLDCLTCRVCSTKLCLSKPAMKQADLSASGASAAYEYTWVCPCTYFASCWACKNSLEPICCQWYLRLRKYLSGRTNSPALKFTNWRNAPHSFARRGKQGAPSVQSKLFWPALVLAKKLMAPHAWILMEDSGGGLPSFLEQASPTWMILGLVTI